MWAEPDEVADDLLDELAAALASADDDWCEPTAAELAALRCAVARRFEPRAHGEVPLRPRPRRRARRVGLVAAGIVALSASGAAATGGVPLPDPLRAAAYAVGLPVDSPALHQTHRHLRALEEAIAAGDPHRVRRAADELQGALTEVPAEERDEANALVDGALDAAASLLDEPGQADDESAGGAAAVSDVMPTSAGLAQVREPAPAPPAEPVLGGEETTDTAIHEAERKSAVTDPPEAAPASEAPAGEPRDEDAPGEPSEPAGEARDPESPAQSDPSSQEAPSSSDDEASSAALPAETSVPEAGDR